RVRTARGGARPTGPPGRPPSSPWLAPRTARSRSPPARSPASTEPAAGPHSIRVRTGLDDLARARPRSGRGPVDVHVGELRQLELVVPGRLRIRVEDVLHLGHHAGAFGFRSEERRVGEEGSSAGAAYRTKSIARL